MKKLMAMSLLSMASLMAESNGAFLGGGFQYSNLENQQTKRSAGFNGDTMIDLTSLQSPSPIAPPQNGGTNTGNTQAAGGVAQQQPANP
ncbi:hypothetical protein [Helicobacter cetorum]|uniref:hypothetical protein n=1 Tax=Helicobacter cetorum TaxID=138563 RepID=UPI001F2A3735|nr:hypothetical protein [Helicobacter cetorum]